MPTELLSLRYREHFNLDYWQVFFTPYKIMVRDMQILGVEAQVKGAYRRAKEKAQRAASGRKK